MSITNTRAKILNLSKNLYFSKPHFWQNSHFQNPIFHKIHIFKIPFFTKFTFFKHQILGNFWMKRRCLPQCTPWSWQKTDLALFKKSRSGNTDVFPSHCLSVEGSAQTLAHSSFSSSVLCLLYWNPSVASRGTQKWKGPTGSGPTRGAFQSLPTKKCFKFQP